MSSNTEVDKMLTIMANNVLQLQSGLICAGAHSSALELGMRLEDALIALARNDLYLTVKYVPDDL